MQDLNSKPTAIFSVSAQPGKRSVTDSEYGITSMSQSERAFDGLVRVVASADDFFGGPDSRDFRDRVLENPSWKAIRGAASRSMRKTGDLHHAFLEGARVVGTEVDKQGRTVQLVELSMGS
jgi:hypothetical protein